MPIPKGFVEVHPVEDPPFIVPERLKAGAVLKYVRSREIAQGDTSDERQLVQGFISATPSGHTVHEFTTRAGQGVSFKLFGTPDLNAKLCVIKPGWIIWLQHVGADKWHLGAAYDLRSLRDLIARMRATDDELDRQVFIAAGTLAAGSATDKIGISDPTAPARRAPRSRPRRMTAEQRAARERQAENVLRKLLGLGSYRIVTDVRDEMRARGFSGVEFQQACEALNVKITRRKASRGQMQYMAIKLRPESDTPVRVTAEAIAEIRSALAAEEARMQDQPEQPAPSSAEVLASGDAEPGTERSERSDEHGDGTADGRGDESGDELLYLDDEDEAAGLDAIFRAYANA